MHHRICQLSDAACAGDGTCGSQTLHPHSHASTGSARSHAGGVELPCPVQSTLLSACTCVVSIPALDHSDTISPLAASVEPNGIGRNEPWQLGVHHA